jgi:hypothetical protein
MKRRWILLILAVALAAAWTLWLGYQALTTADPIVVSRPQIMAAPVVVVAELDEPGSEPRPARVTKIYRGEDVLGVADGGQPQDLKIAVQGLKAVAAGSYILPLREAGPKGEFEVMPPPSSPGFAGRPRSEKPAIYPATPSTELQVREVLRQFRRFLKK